jgi:hypothetical protein
MGGAIEVNVQVVLPAGTQQEITGIQISSSQMKDQVGDTISAAAALDILQIQDGLTQRLHLLPATRQVSAELPGFIYGQYRWRDQTTINAIPLIPQHWDPDVAAIGSQSFAYGIGVNDDLELIDVEEPTDSNSIYPRIQHGAFWNNYLRYWFPAGGYELEFLPVGIGDQSIASQPSFTLQQTPRELSPVFVGTWASDDAGFFDTNIQYRYMCQGFDTSNRPPYNPYQFTLDRKTKTLTLNQGLPNGQLLIGLTSGEATDYFDLPLHPVASILNAWAADPLTASQISINYTFNQQNGTISTSAVLDINGKPRQGLPIWVAYQPAVAVLYETGASDNILVNDGSIELNPAFSGVANGYLYLQTRKQKAGSIMLAADKPLVAEPADSLIPSGMEVYGPVYYQNDYALLTATAYAFSPWAIAPIPAVNPYGLTGGPVIQTNETVPAVEMLVIPGPDWFGVINYQDPSQEDVYVTTGSDGKANMIYLPTMDFGQYLPLSDASGATLTLATPLEYSEIYDAGTQTWVLSTYLVYNNNPYYGQVPTTALRGRQGNGATGYIESLSELSNAYGNPASYEGPMSLHFWFKPAAAPQVSQAQDSYEFGAMGTDGTPKMMFRWNTTDTSNPVAAVVGQSVSGGNIVQSKTVGYTDGAKWSTFTFNSEPTAGNTIVFILSGTWSEWLLESVWPSGYTCITVLGGHVNAAPIIAVFTRVVQSGDSATTNWYMDLDGVITGYELQGTPTITAQVNYTANNTNLSTAVLDYPNASFVFAGFAWEYWGAANFLTLNDIAPSAYTLQENYEVQNQFGQYPGTQQFMATHPVPNAALTGTLSAAADLQVAWYSVAVTYTGSAGSPTVIIPVPEASWPATGAWCDVAIVTANGSNFDVYINNNLVASGSLTGSPYAQFLNFIGLSMNGTVGFSANTIADPAFWTCALTGGDLASLVAGANAAGIEPDSLVSYWLFQGISPEIDYSYSENDGTVVGAIPVPGPASLTTIPAPLTPTQPSNPGGGALYATISSNPESIQESESSTLTWTSDNATTLLLGPMASGSSDATPVEASGALTVSPTQSMTYGLWASGATSELMKARVMVPFVSSTTPGAPVYTLGTGYRILWKVQGQPVSPIYAIDDKGNHSNSPHFDGTVVALVYPYALPNDAYVAAFYVDYIRTVSLMLQAVDNPNVLSNVIYIQMGPPPEIDENPFLIIQDKIQGRINLYRVGGAWPTGLVIPGGMID